MKLGIGPYEEVRGMLRTGSSRHAAELVRLGWTFVSQYPEDEPTELGCAGQATANPHNRILIRALGEPRRANTIFAT